MTDKQIADAVTEAIYALEHGGVKADLLLLQEDVFNNMDIQYAKTFLGLELQCVSGTRSFVLSDPKYVQYREVKWPEGM